MAMQAIQLTRHVITLEEFERMIESGAFDEDARIELIRGEIIDMTPINLPHAACVAQLTDILGNLTRRKAIVWPQGNPIMLPSNSRPEPDVTLLRWRDDFYAGKAPGPEDVLLVIEVSDSSIKYDRVVKAPLYAEAGIPEYWIVNLRSKVIEVYTNPVKGAYKQTKKAHRGDSLPLPGKLEGAIEVSDIVVGRSLPGE